ncbi:MAG: aromatic ring-hydroxylating dioxygenase subunit alpha [Planctomycetota bacterium]|nr:MAG: aromatic ring-hydroxylating dioxygenase subunit alpha [Planctomycetota bacterium]
MDPNLSDHDADVARAALPPAEFYRSPAVHERVVERAFARAWHWIDAEGLPPAGHARPFVLAPGTLDEPLVLSASADGARVHCFSNACTHRGALVVRTSCKNASLRCTYHGRRFDEQGRFVAAPHFEGAADFPAPADDLAPARWNALGPLHFAAVAPRMDFDAWLGSLRTRLAALPLERAELDRSRSRDYEFDAHWALYVDNFLEGLHVPYVHPTLNQAIDFDTYRTELEPWGSVQIAKASDPKDALELANERDVGGLYYWLFPCTMVNVYPWGLSLNVVQPQGHARTRVLFRSYVWDRSRLDQGAGAGLDQVEQEDEAVVQLVQRGLRSRLYRRGRYAPQREHGVHHFHQLLARCLNER